MITGVSVFNTLNAAEEYLVLIKKGKANRQFKVLAKIN